MTEAGEPKETRTGKGRERQARILAAALHPALWRALNLLPLLRTHRLAWIGKPAEPLPS